MHSYTNGITFSNTVTANGSNGLVGQVLTSSGATGNVYWSSAGVNTAASYTWTNTHTFSANVTLSALKTYIEDLSAPTISAGLLTLNLSNTSIFNVALNGNITTLTISNPAASGSVSSFVLIFTADGTPRSVTWGSAVKWVNGTSPILTSTNGKKDVFTFFTTDGGTSYNAFISGQNI